MNTLSPTVTTLGDNTDDGRTGCKPYYLGTDCNMTYAKYLGRAFTITHIIYAIVVISALLFTLLHAYKTVRVKGFKPLQSVQVRLYIFILLGMLLLAFRIFDPFGWTAVIPFQIILISYDLSGTMTLAIGLDIVFDWLRVVQIAGGQLILSSKFRYVCLSLQLGTLIVLLCFSLCQSFVGPWWLFHSLKTSVYILVSTAMLGLFLLYGFRVQRIIKDHEDLHSRHTTWTPPETTTTRATTTTTTTAISPVSHSSSSAILTSSTDPLSYNPSNMTHTSSFTSISTNNNQSSDDYYAAQDYPNSFDDASCSSSTQPISISNATSRFGRFRDEEHIFQPITSSVSSPITQSSIASQSHVPSQPTQISQITQPIKEEAPKIGKKSAGAKVPKLIIIIIALLAVSLLLWAYVLFQEISHQCTVQNSCNLARDRILSLLAAAAYDLVHLFAYVSICLFFGIQKNSSPDAEKKTKSSKRSGVLSRLNNRDYARLNDDGVTNGASNQGSSNDNNNTTVVGSLGSSGHVIGSKPTTRSLFPKSSLYSSTHQHNRSVRLAGSHTSVGSSQGSSLNNYVNDSSDLPHTSINNNDTGYTMTPMPTTGDQHFVPQPLPQSHQQDFHQLSSQQHQLKFPGSSFLGSTLQLESHPQQVPNNNISYNDATMSFSNNGYDSIPMQTTNGFASSSEPQNPHISQSQQSGRFHVEDIEESTHDVGYH